MTAPVTGVRVAVGAPLELAWAPDGRSFGTVGFDGVALWDATLAQPVRVQQLSSGGTIAYGPAISPDNRFVAAGLGDCTLRSGRSRPARWPIASAMRIPRSAASPRGSRSAPTARRLIYGCPGFKMFYVVDLPSGRVLHACKAERSAVWKMVIAPDGSWGATVGAPPEIWLWDLQTGQQAARIGGHAGKVDHIAVSADGARLASCSSDKTVRVWDRATGRELACFGGHRKAIHQVSLAPDGSRVASACNDGLVPVWDVASQQLIAQHNCPSGALSVAFSPNGWRLLALDGSGGAWLWPA